MSELKQIEKGINRRTNLWKSLYTHKSPCPVKKVEVEFSFSGRNYTDGEKIHLSFFEEEVGTSFKSKLINLEAKMIHECAHINYTAFKSINDRVRRQKNPNLYHTIFNITEDGRIERIMSESIVGANKKLRFLNIFLFRKGLIEEVSESPMERLMTNMLYYSKLGLYQRAYDDSYEDFKVFKEEIMPRVDKIVNSNVNTSFFYLLDELYDIFFSYFEKENEENKQALQDMLDALSDALDDHSENRDNGDNYDGSGTFEGSRFKQKEEENEEQNGSGTSSNDDEEQEENDSSNSSSGKKGKEKEAGEEETDKSGNSDGEEERESDSNSKEAKDEDSKKDEDKNSDIIDNIQDEVDSIEESIEAIELPEEKEMTDPIEEELKEQGRKNAEKELHKFQATTKDHGDSHYLSEVQNPKPLTNTDLQMKSRVLKKTFSDILKNKEKFSLTAQNKGVLNPGLLYSASYNSNVFTIPGAKQDRSYSVTILVDGSGSMCGKKIKDATDAAVILEEALKEFVTLRISKFTTSSNGVTTMVMKDFGDKKKGNYSFGSDYNAYNGNYDYVNLVYEAGILEVRPETDKIMFILSDGYPCGFNATEKMKIAVKTVKEKGITLIPIFFAEDESELVNMTETFKEMYGENVIASKPEDISKHLSKVMKKFLEK